MIIGPTWQKPINLLATQMLSEDHQQCHVWQIG